MASIYEKLPPDFFDSSQKSMNPVTNYYHSNRYAKIRDFISSSYRKGMKILDIGSGSGSWNTTGLPLTGLDQNRAMLEYGRESGYLKKAIVWDLNRIPLPLKDSSYDYIVISEVLEHLDMPGLILKESARILKSGGRLVVTVPLDTPLSAWSILFGMNCFVLGNVLGNEYYRNKCGHVQHFSPQSISKIIENKDFRIVRKDITILNIGMMARKGLTHAGEYVPV